MSRLFSSSGIVPGASARAWSRAAALAALAIALAPSTVLGQSIFTCKDASGRTLTSDRPIPECQARPMRELSLNGTIKREIAAPLTPEELRRKAEDDERRRIAEAQQRREQQRDRALLLAYPSLTTLENMRARHLADIEQDAFKTRRRMIDNHADLKTARAQAAPGRDGAPDLAARRRIDELRQAILRDDDRLARLESDAKSLNQRFDEDATRLRELLREPEPDVRRVSLVPGAAR
jgi:hypothetical protein